MTPIGNTLTRASWADGALTIQGESNSGRRTVHRQGQPGHTPARRPEADATRDLYERYARQIYAYCLHQLGNREEAEDAMQSTFLNAFRGFKRGVDPEFESAWLYKIAQNVCLTRQRSSSRRRRVERPAISTRCRTSCPRTRSTRTS